MSVYGYGPSDQRYQSGVGERRPGESRTRGFRVSEGTEVLKRFRWVDGGM